MPTPDCNRWNPFAEVAVAVRKQVQTPVIRPMTVDDVAVVAEMVRQLAEFEKLSQINHCTAGNLFAELSRPDSILEGLLAFETGHAVGMALFFPTFSTFAGRRGLYLEDLFVLPSHRHHGIGTALLRQVARIAVERNYGRMEWTTLLWNTPSIEFYESLGATPNDAWTTFRLLEDGVRRLAGLELAATE